MKLRAHQRQRRDERFDGGAEQLARLVKKPIIADSIRMTFSGRLRRLRLLFGELLLGGDIWWGRKFWRLVGTHREGRRINDYGTGGSKYNRPRTQCQPLPADWRESARWSRY